MDESGSRIFVTFIEPENFTDARRAELAPTSTGIIGELVIDDIYGEHAVKLPAGDMVVYPASSLHHVKPVTRGVRLASFFWVQSMVRDDRQRAMLFELDQSIQKLRGRVGDCEETVSLTGHYHNLLRMWAEV